MKQETFQIIAFFAVITIVALAIVRILRPVTTYIENVIFEYQTARSIIKQRKGGVPVPGTDPLQLRRTDNAAAMSKSDRVAYNQAEQLLKQGKLLEASQIFESIGFSRRAIDILEGAGMIDEACAVLIRMKSVARAGVVFERNHMYEKAAHCFTAAQQHENAGKAWRKLTQNDFRYFNLAAESFAKAGSWDHYLHALAEVLDTKKVIEAAIAQGRVEAIVGYMANPEIARDALPILGREAMTRVLTSLPLTPKLVLQARTWVSLSADYDLELLNVIHRDPDLCAFFWAGLDETSRTRLAMIIQSASALPDDIRAKHLEAEARSKAAPPETA